jgi:prophage antirepressor-like protein
MKTGKSVQSAGVSDKMASKKPLESPTGESGEVVRFNESGMSQLEVWLEGETIWLTQAQLAELFGVKLNTVNYHIKAILKSGELSAEATIRKIRIVQVEGGRQVSRPVDFHNLDMIISIGYRVNSMRATKFRQWATSVLKEYLLRGLVRDQRIGKLEKRMTAAERSIDTIICTLMPALPENREPIGFHK